MRSVLAQIVVLVVASSCVSVPGSAHALSCGIPETLGFFDCSAKACAPLFEVEFRLTGDGCRGRWIVESMEADVAARLRKEIETRAPELNGVVQVEFRKSWFTSARILPEFAEALEENLLHAEIEAVPGSPESLRGTWEAKASRGFWRMVRRKSVGWAWAAALFFVLFLSARQVWSARAGSHERRWPLAVAFAVQALCVLVGYGALLHSRASWSSVFVPVALLVPIGGVLLIAESLALLIGRLRARGGPQPNDRA